MTERIANLNDTPLTLAAFQRHIHDRYYHTDHDRGTPATFMWFIEEVGELATALHKTASSPSDQDSAASQNLEEEFADCLAWLCTLANINGVDLGRAVAKKYQTGPGPLGHK